MTHLNGIFGGVLWLLLLVAVVDILLSIHEIGARRIARMISLRHESVIGQVGVVVVVAIVHNGGDSGDRIAARIITVVAASAECRSMYSSGQSRSGRSSGGGIASHLLLALKLFDPLLHADGRGWRRVVVSRRCRCGGLRREYGSRCLFGLVVGEGDRRR